MALTDVLVTWCKLYSQTVLRNVLRSLAVIFKCSSTFVFSLNSSLSNQNLQKYSGPPGVHKKDLLQKLESNKLDSTMCLSWCPRSWMVAAFR